jgi:MFS family permease
MALPTVPTAVLNSVTPTEIGKASGINYMMQRFGAVFGIAIAGAIFSTYGHLGTPAAFTDGFKPALAACAILSLLASLAAIAVGSGRRSETGELEPAEATAVI